MLGLLNFFTDAAPSVCFGRFYNIMVWRCLAKRIALHAISVMCDFTLRAAHLLGHGNRSADSRFKFQKYRILCPNTDVHICLVSFHFLLCSFSVPVMLVNMPVICAS